MRQHGALSLYYFWAIWIWYRNLVLDGIHLSIKTTIKRPLIASISFAWAHASFPANSKYANANCTPHTYAKNKICDAKNTEEGNAMWEFIAIVLPFVSEEKDRVIHRAVWLVSIFALRRKFQSCPPFEKLHDTNQPNWHWLELLRRIQRSFWPFFVTATNSNPKWFFDLIMRLYLHSAQFNLLFKSASKAISNETWNNTYFVWLP